MRADPTGAGPTRLRVARALVVAALVTPAVVLAHLLTRGALPGPLGVLALAGLTALVTLAVPAAGRVRLAAAVVAAQAAGHALLFVSAPSGGTGCLPAVGRGAQAGLQLALLRADGVCSPAEAAAAATLSALVGATLTGLAVVVGQVAVATLAARFVAVAEPLAATVVHLVAAVLPTLPATVTAVPAGAPRPLPRQPVRPMVTRLDGPAPLRRRGPPALVAA